MIQELGFLEKASANELAAAGVKISIKDILITELRSKLTK